jgi:uncharacterized protein (TIGR03545 family)
MFKKITGKIIILIILLLISAYFIRNMIITRIVEKEATKINKAIVEVDNLNYSVFGNKLTTGRIQVSDVRDTSKNLLEAEGLSVEVKLGEILDETLIIKDVFLEGIRLGTTRDKDGRVDGLTPQKSDKTSSYDELMGNLKKSNVEEISPQKIIQDELDNLISGFDKQVLSKYEEDRSMILQRKEYWKGKLSSSENKEKLQDLKVRAESLVEEIKKTKNPFTILEKEKELRAIYSETEDMYKGIEADKKSFEKDLKKFGDLPEKYKDIAVLNKNQLQSLIKLDSKNLEKLINRILGQELGDSIYDLVNEFNGLKQKIDESSSQGEEPPVDVFVEKARMTMNIAGISIEGQATNIPSDPQKSRGPVDFDISGGKGDSKINIDGFVNLLSDEQQMNLKLEKLQLSEFTKELSFGDALFSLTQELNIKGKSPSLKGNLEILDFTAKEFIGTENKDITNIILSEAVKNLKDIKINYYYDKSVKQLKINSNLPEKLSASLQASLKSNSGLLTNILQDKYGEKAEVYFEDIKVESDSFKEDIGELLDLNSQEVNDVIDEIKKNTGLDGNELLKKLF